MTRQKELEQRIKSLKVGEVIEVRTASVFRDRAAAFRIAAREKIELATNVTLRGTFEIKREK